MSRAAGDELEGRFQLSLVRGRPLFERPNLTAVLNLLIDDPMLAPETMRLDEGARRPVDLAHVLDLATGHSRSHELELARSHAIRHQTVMLLGDPPGLSLELARHTIAHRKRVFELADELVRIDPPEIAWVHHFEDREPPHSTKDDELSALMDAGITGIGPTYDTLGPGGLGLRTYLGPRLVQLVGRERIQSLPVPFEELSEGVIRIDLIEEPWAADRVDATKSWRRAMDHLRPAKVFGVPRLDKAGFASVRRGEGFVRP